MSQDDKLSNPKPEPEKVAAEIELSPEELEKLNGGGMDGSMGPFIHRMRMDLDPNLPPPKF